MQYLKSSIFRGATKPVMFLGVPLSAMVYVFIPFALLFLTALNFGGFLYAFISLLPLCAIIPVMREMTKRDDQYLRMFGIEIRDKLKCSKNRLDDLIILPAKELRDKRFMRY